MEKRIPYFTKHSPISCKSGAAATVRILQDLRRRVGREECAGVAALRMGVHSGPPSGVIEAGVLGRDIESIVHAKKEIQFW